MGSLAVQRLEGTVAALAERSRGWRDLLARTNEDAVLVIASPSDDALVLGAFQRASEVVPAGGWPGSAPAIERRGSGGAAASVGAGTIWLQLALARTDALFEGTPDKLLNRHVRPLLRALGRVTGVPASYFGRDWISSAHRPVGLVAFAHDAGTGQALFEAIIAVSRPFASAGRPSFLGKSPATLDEIAGRTVERDRLVDEAIAAYAGPAPVTVEHALLQSASPVAAEPPWAATRSEAIGIIAAGRDAPGRLRVGGELMASSDAMMKLEALIAALPPDASPDEVGRVVDEALAAPGVTTFGVRALASLRDVVIEALRAKT